MALSSLLKWSRKKVPAPARVETAGSTEVERLPEDTGNKQASHNRLIRDRRYGHLLDCGGPEPTDGSVLASAWTALEQDMALVSGGQITLGAPQPAYREGPAGADRPEGLRTAVVSVFYLDRYAVTNRDFACFVAAGGYDQMDLWPLEIWPSVLRFVDQAGLSGPRFWSQGRPVRGQESHPVVGVCWYEACAYARWVGKRLPTAAEWEKAGSWPADLAGCAPAARYPWGNGFEPNRANTWHSGAGTTVPVDEYPNGCTPNGIYQMVGNTWEWLDDVYDPSTVSDGLRISFEQPMREIRGGAFDTYFEIQATCQFSTAQPALKRSGNVGFRCALSIDRLRPRP